MLAIKAQSLKAQSLRRALLLLLAMLVLLAQGLVLTHRVAHAPTGASAATVSVANVSALDALFGHSGEAACDEFDAAFGADVNPGYAKATSATKASPQTRVMRAGAGSASFPHRLPQARAPPSA